MSKFVCSGICVTKNRSIVSFCCFMKISWLELQLNFEECSGEVDNARQTFQSGCAPLVFLAALKAFSLNVDMILQITCDPTSRTMVKQCCHQIIGVA